jgi:hypothetical protein
MIPHWIFEDPNNESGYCCHIDHVEEKRHRQPLYFSPA